MSLKFALEDNEPEVVEEPSEEVPAEVEAGAADVEAGSTEVEDGLGEIETAGEDTAAIGEIADVVERSVTPDENGEGGEGLSPEAAEIAEIAVERLRERIGLKKSSKSEIWARNSFVRSSMSRVVTTMSCVVVTICLVRA